MAAAPRVEIFLPCGAVAVSAAILVRWPLPRPSLPTVLKNGKAKGRRPMRCSRIRARRGSDPSRYTHLSACVSEEEDGFTVQVRLFNEARPEHVAWGEEIADSFETASALLDTLAAAFAIPQARVKIRIRMENPSDGTRH